MSVKGQFEICLNSIENVIEFKSEWHNGTGYFDNLVYEEIQDLSVGDRFKTVDQNGRRIAGVVTPFGNVVVFERYSDSENGPVVNNTPTELNAIIRSGAMSGPEILSALGGFEFENNIGKVLDLAMKMAVGEYTPRTNR